MDTPRIYVACLASYNAGKLHGEWIDANQDVDAIQEEVNAMLRASPEPNVYVTCPDCDGVVADPFQQCATCKGQGRVPSAEEWAIHDYEGFHGIKLSEYESFDKVAEIAAAIEEHGEAFALYVDLVGSEYATVEGFQDAYLGEYDSEKDYAYEYIDSTGMLSEVPQNIQNYFDYDAFARDLFMDLHYVNGHVFDTNR